jgi:hypothetical protein
MPFDLRYQSRRLQAEQDPEPQWVPPTRSWIEPRQLYNPDGVLGQVYRQLPPGTLLTPELSPEHPASMGPMRGYPDPHGVNFDPDQDFLRGMFQEQYQRDYESLQPAPQISQRDKYRNMLRQLAMRRVLQSAGPLSNGRWS